MKAHNMSELKANLIKALNSAMDSTSKKVLEDMEKETTNYYSDTKPKRYVRTYQLRETPRVKVNKLGETVEIKAYLDTSHQYTTGDKPDMLKVLNLANYGKPWITENGKLAAPTIGRQGFWERAEEKMLNRLDSSIKKYFK